MIVAGQVPDIAGQRVRAETGETADLVDALTDDPDLPVIAIQAATVPVELETCSVSAIDFPTRQMDDGLPIASALHELVFPQRLGVLDPQALVPFPGEVAPDA